MTTRLRKGAYKGRYEVHDGDRHIGWVVGRSARSWRAFVNLPSTDTGLQVGGAPFLTRREAVYEVKIRREV